MAAVDAAEKGVGRNKGAVPVGARRQLARARQLKVAIRNLVAYIFKHKRLLFDGWAVLAGTTKTVQVFVVPVLFLSYLKIINFYWDVKRKLAYKSLKHLSCKVFY